MSEFTLHKQHRVEKLVDLFLVVIREELSANQVADYRQVIDSAEPGDVIAVVDELVKLQIAMPGLKKGINKALNLLNKTLREYPYQAPASGSFLYWLIRNNELAGARLKAIRPLLKELNQNEENFRVRVRLKESFEDLLKIDQHYQIKENVLFPKVEKYLPDYRCLHVMWSFHDDIRRNLKEIIQMLDTQIVDISRFNRLFGDIFFNIYAIRFREERILFPAISAFIPEYELDTLIPESIKVGFPFVQPDVANMENLVIQNTISENIDLKTGSLSTDQIRLIFNHLPIDITFVDENDKVKFFSSPEKRIFRRTNSIIGRDVKNCHPHESIHVVEQIIEAFRKGEKNKASLWIQMKGEFILIQYFAVRDEQGNYKGVVEVTQEISEIVQLEGEQRLLDWEK